MKNFADLSRRDEERRALKGSMLLLLIIVLIIFFLLWAYFTEIDDVTRADGRVVPSKNVQIVQAPDPGVIKSIRVRRGQLVSEGDLLAELDPTSMSSEFDQQRTRVWALSARIARLQAQVDGAETIDFPPELFGHAPTILRSEVALFGARRDELLAEIEVLEQQRRQRLEEFEEAEVEGTTARSTLALVEAEIGIIAPLVRRRIEPETTLLALRRSLVDVQGRSARSEAAVRRLTASLGEVDDRIEALKARFRSEAHGQLALAAAELAEARARLPAFEHRLTRSEIRAPVRGTVNLIHVTTIGGVVQAGHNLIEIVPAEDSLLVEAFVKPADIAFLYPGQPAKVKVTAYDFSRYGSIQGRIVRIGADSTRRPDRDERAFVVEIQTETNILDATGAALEILPGMVVEADILSGRRSILQYLTQPIVRVRDRALRD